MPQSSGMYVIDAPTLKPHYSPTYTLALETLKYLQGIHPEKNYSISNIIKINNHNQEYLFCNWGFVPTSANGKQFETLVIQERDYENTFGLSNPNLSPLFTFKFQWYQWRQFKKTIKLAFEPQKLQKYKTFYIIECDMSCLSVSPFIANKLTYMINYNEKQLDQSYSKDFLV